MSKPDFGYPLPDFIGDRWDEINVGYLSLVFAQAEKRLAETTKTADTITTRAYALLGISVTITTLTLGYLVSHSIADQSDQIFIISCALILMILPAVFWKLLRCILPYQIDVSGSEPKLLFDENFIDGFPEEEQAKNLYLNECKSYQERINHNQHVNRIRMTLFSESLKLIALTPLSFVLAWAALQVYSLF